MIARAFESFRNLIKEQFPDVDVLINWPPPHKKIKYPSLILITPSQSLMRYMPKFLLNEQRDEEVINHYNTGQWEVRLDMHYISTSLKDQSNFIDAVNSFFDQEIAEDVNISSNRVFSFGSRDFEKANISFLSWNLDQSSFNIKSGERRCIFELLLDIPNLVESRIPVIKRIESKIEIGEKVDA